MSDPLLRIVCTCPYVPVQFEGTCCGIPFYYRARFGKWRLVQVTVTACTWEELRDAPVIASGEWPTEPYADGTIAFGLEQIVKWAATVIGSHSY